ncbi:nuclear transport factor 2 family protein [Streptomyces albipurpureus]|uniref:Nuclear transport factor 2 family protein n=1 Tax=Streptomyces albipurpureus TaxID=2897419 RepID=A0ABT0UP22_9ACTN|nr:nuclear transport factor 2 family protein [Streptomyces sp. CWNU-1]MCM2389991.1 nuclear transport factor 2 family protein [Streptomyces sp. CWNU-1]
MKPLETQSPEQFIADFLTTFTEAVVQGAQEPVDVMSRYHTRDVVQYADGVRLDWDRLLAHLRPVRRNVVEFRFEVHEAIADGTRIAARFTIHARMRKSGPVSTQVHLFAEFTEDGLMRRSEQLTRTLPSAEVPASR